MKKLIIALCTLVIVVSSLPAITTGKSIFFSDSYMLRARGVEAAYWNPANLIPSCYIDMWLPGLNTGVYVANNSLDLETYNFIVSKDYLSDKDKTMLLSKIKHSLKASFNGNTSIAGFTLDNISLSSSVSFMGQASVSKKYLELALYGNTDSLYAFDKTENDANMLCFTDFTFGAGNFIVPLLPDHYPEIRAGFSASILAGIGSADVDNFNGYFSSGWDGITMHQDLKVRSGIGGYGFKGMLGLATNPMPELELGLTLDNLFGFINWDLITEQRSLHIVADSLYLANIGEDFYSETHETIDINAFSIELPPELRLGSMWRGKEFNVSADYVQGFKNSVLTSSIGRFALGAELMPFPFIKVSLGLGLGNSNYPWRTSYGIGFNSKTAEIGVSVQSMETLIPGAKSKGIAIGSFIRLWI
ncbi:MAG: hypothetical protein RBS43_01035 [Candidatus Cloacimonas sp.]|jgi:hypothetical protein|nr:hypothetical protein [Candidatus Cloacimonas sp.]